MELSFEGLEMEKWIIPTDRAQRVDEKNGVLCLVFWWQQKITHSLGKYLNALERYFSENGMVNRLWSTVREILRVKI